MLKINLYTSKGEKKGQLSLPKEIFGVKVNRVLLAQAVRIYLSNQRRARAKVKARSEVRGSRRKIWRQKGTGRARHGDRYAPIFVGGGVAHGPTGRENYQRKLTKKMRQEALFSALSAKAAQKEILAIEGLEKIKPKTKTMSGVLAKVLRKAASSAKAKEGRRKISLVLPDKIESVIRAARNIKGVSLLQARLLNPYQVLNSGQMILMPESVEVLKKVFLAKRK